MRRCFGCVVFGMVASLVLIPLAAMFVVEFVDLDVDLRK